MATATAQEELEDESLISSTPLQQKETPPIIEPEKKPPTRSGGGVFGLANIVIGGAAIVDQIRNNPNRFSPERLEKEAQKHAAWRTEEAAKKQAKIEKRKYDKNQPVSLSEYKKAKQEYYNNYVKQYRKTARIFKNTPRENLSPGLQKAFAIDDARLAIAQASKNVDLKKLKAENLERGRWEERKRQQGNKPQGFSRLLRRIINRQQRGTNNSKETKVADKAIPTTGPQLRAIQGGASSGGQQVVAPMPRLRVIQGGRIPGGYITEGLGAGNMRGPQALSRVSNLPNPINNKISQAKNQAENFIKNKAEMMAKQAAQKLLQKAAMTPQFWIGVAIVVGIVILIALFLTIFTTILGGQQQKGVLASITLSPAPTQQRPSQVVYCQWDRRWSDQVYNDGTVGNTGCVPTSMAMILSSYGGTTYNPGQVATMFHALGWDYDPGSGYQGTNPWDITSTWLSTMGFKRAQSDIVNNWRMPVYLSNTQVQQIKNYTDAGWLLMAAVDGHNLPTPVDGGHEVVIQSADPIANTITIRDPNSPACRSGRTVTIDASSVPWYLITPIMIK